MTAARVDISHAGLELPWTTQPARRKAVWLCVQELPQGEMAWLQLGVRTGNGIL